MVFTVDQLFIIQDYVKKTGSRVFLLHNIREDAEGLCEQQSIDREIPRELRMGDSPAYTFCCNAIHNVENYKEGGYKP
jgi:hypothetical protein